MGTPEVSIIIPVFNRVELTRQCLEALYRTVPPGAAEIIVVDNGSTDGTPDFLSGEAQAGRIAFIRAGRNLGFARACNLGALKSRGRLLVFLNNDTIPTPGWLNAMLKAATLPDVGVVGAKLLYPDGRIQHAGVVFLRGRPEHVCRFAPGDAPEASRLRDLDMVTGACLLIPKELFFAVGGFDETFLNGYEDVDLCLKVRALGRRVIYQPEAVVYHLEGQTEGRFEGDPENFAEFSSRWRACFGRGGRLEKPAPPANLVSARGLLLNPEGPADGLRVVWQAPLFDLSGYTDEARQFVLGLHEAGIPLKAAPLYWARNWVKLPPEEALTLARVIRLIDPPGDGPAVGVFHAIPDAYRPMPGVGLKVARTMFETDRIPEHWVEILNRFDRVWVPSGSNLESFAKSGVDPAKLRVVPSPLDTRRFTRPVEPLDIPGRRSFNFLSVLDFQLRKGWDVLIKAFAEAFGPDEDVALILKVFSYRRLSQARIRQEMEKLLGRELPPNIIPYFKELGTDEMPALYAAADAFVLPTRGEGFCRPAAEAMASGLPVIITGWGGHLDFAAPETAYLIDCKLVPVPEKARQEIGVPLPAGARWAEPSAEHLKALMREVVERPAWARARAEAGRRKVLAELGRAAVTERVVAELRELGARVAPPLPRRHRPHHPPPQTEAGPVVWEGDFTSAHSFARVNRDLTRALKRAGVRVIPLEPSGVGGAGGFAASAPPAPVLWVRHRWPPDFDPPPAGRFAVIQPWEYGAVPRAWVEGINRSGAELWVPSAFVRERFVEGGVAADRVYVVPNGVDPERFHPGVRPLSLDELKPGAEGLASGRFRFLFVGGTLWRKGVDLLLKAYTKAFGPKDDVVLIIKDAGTASFYRGQGLGAQVRRAELLGLSGDGPAVLYIDRELPDEDLPGLYAACHCLVHPFRGEGFGLPAAEAMAVGLPVITTGAGPALEFADETTAYLIPAKPTPLRSRTDFDGLELVSRPWVFEPDEEALAQLLRHVYDHCAEARQKGEAAARRIHGAFTWEHTARAVLEALGLRRRAAHGAVTPAAGHTHGATAPTSAGVFKHAHGAVGPAAARRAHGNRSDRPLISLCMIAKDAAGDLPRCLESVRDIADEIIVVDTGSTDGTPEVARSFGARVISFPWTGSFAEARNESLRHARGRWILVLDADEALGRGKEKLREILAVADADGFLLPQVTYLGFEPGSADAVVVPAVRLFRNLPGLKFTRRLHEQILESLQQVKPTVRLGVLNVEIEHFGYLESAGKAPQKHRRNIELARKDLAERPSDAFSWFNLGQEYYAAGRFPAALFCFRRAVRYLPGEYRMWLPRALELAALSALRLGRPRGALKLLEEAAAAVGNHPNLRLLEGQARLALGEVAAARRAFSAALKASCPGLDIRNEGASGYAGWYWLGRCAELEGKPREALRAFVESVQLSLSAGRCYRPAVEALVRLLSVAVSGRQLVGALKSFFPGMPSALALEAARAVFAEPPVSPAGIEAAELLLQEAGAPAGDAAGLINLFAGRFSEAAQAAGPDTPLGRIARALAGGAPLEPLVPPSREFVGWLLGVLLQLGQFERFEELMPLVERLWPEPAERATVLGRLYGKFGFWDLAVETLAPEALAGRLDGEALSLLAGALEKTGSPEAAKEVWLEVIRKDPSPLAAARAYAALAALRLAGGDGADAVRLLDLAAQLTDR
jgi:glycosyltransferase involved in cell wall biosynthesis